MGNELSAAERAGQMSAIDEEGVHSSNVYDNAELVTYTPDVATMHESFRLAVARYPGKPCLGKRMGHFLDYSQAAKRIDAFGSGLKKFAALERGAVVGIMAGAGLETTVVCQAANAFSWAVVPLFESFPADAATQVVKEAACSVMVCSSMYTSFVLDAKMPSVKFVVQIQELRVGQREKAQSHGVTLFSMEDVELCGVDYPQAHVPPKPSDVCHITVSPGSYKLTRWTHAQFLTQVSSLAIGFWMLYATADESYFSFNSLAFYWERMLQELMFVTGSAIAFSSRGDVLEEMKSLKPTFLAVIPQFFGFINARLGAGLDQYSIATKTLFFQAFEQKKAALLADGISYTSTVYDSMFFNEVRAVLGGRVNLIMSIGDWVDPLPLTFLRCTLCCPIVLAYGTSEAGILTCTHKSDVTPGSLGPPLPGVEIKLNEVANLELTGEWGEPGEISVRWNRGPWIVTGDLGRWTPSKATLQFMDRIDSTVKVDATRYWFLGRLSNMYSRNKWVKQIFVYQDRKDQKLCAVVVPDLYELTQYATELQEKFTGLLDGPTDPATLVAHGGVRKMVLESLRNTRAELGLEEYETIERIRFQIEPFSIENKFLSVTLKQRRDKLNRDFND